MRRAVGHRVAPHHAARHQLRRRQLVRAIIATRDERTQTAHDVAAETNPEQQPDAVRRLLSQRGARTVHARRDGYQRWHAEAQDRRADRMQSNEQHLRTDQSSDYGIDL